MKTYDFKKVKQIIRKNASQLESASLGIHEDWFWTAETIYENKKYRRVLPNNADEIYKEYIKKRKNGMGILDKERKAYDCILIGGIYGSCWGTPTLQLCFKNGTEEMIEVSNGEKSGSSPQMDIFGCLSSPVQENIKPLK